MDMEYTISIGLNDKDSHRQEISTEDAYQIVFDAFPDCTVKEYRGSFTHSDGVRVIERSFQVVVYADSSEKPRLVETCRMLKIALNQEAIFLSSRRIDSEMI